MLTRKRVLFLSQNLPFPPDAGVKSRTYNVIRQLSKAFDLDILCFTRRAGSSEGVPEGVRVKELGRYGRVFACPIPEEHSRLRLFANHLTSVVRQRVYTRYSYRSREYLTALRQVLSERPPDLVHSDSLDLALYFHILPDVPVACTHHDVQSLLLLRRGQRVKSAWLRSYLGMQARWTEREERTWCPQVALNVTVSEADATVLRAIAGGRGKFVTIPNGVDTTYFVPEGNTGALEDRLVLFVGGATWFPNLDGMRHFCAAILPELRKVVPDVQVRWVGRVSQELRVQFARSYGVEVTGFVPDIRPHLHAAACVIAPLRVGGGTRVKILDAWAAGKAVVTTTIGAEGLSVLNDRNALVRDEPAAFAAAVREVLLDPVLRTRLGAEARATVLREYSWETIGHALVGAYQSLVLEWRDRG